MGRPPPVTMRSVAAPVTNSSSCIGGSLSALWLRRAAPLTLDGVTPHQ